MTTMNDYTNRDKRYYYIAHVILVFISLRIATQ